MYLACTTILACNSSLIALITCWRAFFFCFVSSWVNNQLGIITLSHIADFSSRIVTSGTYAASELDSSNGVNTAHALISAFSFWSLFSKRLEYVFAPLFAFRVVAPCYPMHDIMNFYLWALYICKHLVWHLLWTSFDDLDGIWLPANYCKDLSFHWQSRSCAAKCPLCWFSLLIHHVFFWGL